MADTKAIKQANAVEAAKAVVVAKSSEGRRHNFHPELAGAFHSTWL